MPKRIRDASLPLAIGVDLGGTHALAVLMDATGCVHARHRASIAATPRRLVAFAARASPPPPPSSSSSSRGASSSNDSSARALDAFFRARGVVVAGVASSPSHVASPSRVRFADDDFVARRRNAIAMRARDDGAKTTESASRASRRERASRARVWRVYE